MKTIRLSDEEYQRLLYVLRFTEDVCSVSTSQAANRVALFAEDITVAILTNTNQHDDDDDDDGLGTVDDSQENERWERI